MHNEDTVIFQRRQFRAGIDVSAVGKLPILYAEAHSSRPLTNSTYYWDYGIVWVEQVLGARCGIMRCRMIKNSSKR